MLERCVLEVSAGWSCETWKKVFGQRLRKRQLGDQRPNLDLPASRGVGTMGLDGSHVVWLDVLHTAGVGSRVRGICSHAYWGGVRGLTSLELCW